jgi:hypothetical protein
MKSAICLLCVEPHPSHIKFLESILGEYTKIMLCDSSTGGYTSDIIQFINIEDNVCYNEGYKNMNYCVPKNPSAWDKAMYYFCKIDPSYDYVWFLEDDVFVSSIDAVSNMDKKYPECDLLSKQNTKITDGHTSEWIHWQQGLDHHPLPWYISMICACRLSKALLQKIKEYVDNNHTLFFLEIMVNTLSMHHDLTVVNPVELQNIMPTAQVGKRVRRYKNGKYTWVQQSIDNVEPNYFYHPMKDIDLHDKFRLN